jgi:hypothetical protein
MKPWCTHHRALALALAVAASSFAAPVLAQGPAASSAPAAGKPAGKGRPAPAAAPAPKTPKAAPKPAPPKGATPATAPKGGAAAPPKDPKGATPDAAKAAKPATPSAAHQVVERESRIEFDERMVRGQTASGSIYLFQRSPSEFKSIVTVPDSFRSRTVDEQAPRKGAP